MMGKAAPLTGRCLRSIANRGKTRRLDCCSLGCGNTWRQIVYGAQLIVIRCGGR